MIALSLDLRSNHQQRSWISASKRWQTCLAVFIIIFILAWTSVRRSSWTRYSLDFSVINTAMRNISDKKAANSTASHVPNASSTTTSQPLIRPSPVQDLANLPPVHHSSLSPYHLLNTTATFSVAPFPPLPQGDEEEYIAFCLIIKNQSLDMPEFFTHHYYHHGVRRFYVYDDGSQPPLSAKPFISSWGIPDSAINFTYISDDTIVDRGNLQVDMYTDCTRRARNRHKWVAWLDPDEFLEMRGENPPTLKNFLQGWEKNETVGALGVHWLAHNSDGHLEIQARDIRKSYTMCVDSTPLETDQEPNACPKPANKHVKTFVRTDRFKEIENIHWAKTTDDTIEVNEHGDLIWTWCHEPVTHDIWALHHYITKSREDFEIKKGRHRVEGGNLSEQWWDCMHQQMANVTCPELAAYVP